MPGGAGKTSQTEPNPAWVAFFAEAMRLAELARQRRAARESEIGNEERQDKESDNAPTGENMTTGKCP